MAKFRLTLEKVAVIITTGITVMINDELRITAIIYLYVVVVIITLDSQSCPALLWSGSCADQKHRTKDKKVI